jgi:hypothetical protein
VVHCLLSTQDQEEQLQGIASPQVLQSSHLMGIGKIDETDRIMAGNPEMTSSVRHATVAERTSNAPFLCCACCRDYIII